MIMSTMMNVYKNIIIDLFNEYVKHNIECIANNLCKIGVSLEYNVVQFDIHIPITAILSLIYYWRVPIAM